ncbi:TPA: RecQ family ATP-dependent DNA helicase [Bacillus thuringiensis]|uniref:RecQ family ATP-dependent DNA helicase n=1 Tax=Bacillus sp. CH_70 TaxID=2978215 RepID=UPI001BCE8FD6|nr:RecQ family ATP-dependent DNA helicase [Bacillus toyonensis]HDR7707805.1 RecQ family ATP-dependent DNA helicase [Bacillus thuringiensis]
MKAHAERIFKSYLPNNNLKPDQWKAINLLLENKRTLVIQPTGWGKSVVYFVAAKLFREQNKGITIIISPLLALIRNQLEAAAQMGLNAYTINSDNTEEWETANKAIVDNHCDLLIVAPERLHSDSFREDTLPLIEKGPGIGLIVVDEAHCISDWGHDFRPKYKKIIQFVNTLQKQIPMLATTATANARVAEDIKTQLENNVEIIRGSLIRENLYLKIISAKNSYEKMGWLDYHLSNDNLKGSGIVYCTTQKECEKVTRWLISRGIDADYYHSGIKDKTKKEEIEKKLINNKLKVVVSTIALGMGFDKKDVRFVIHYNLSSSLITYYQEIGRGGRDNKGAEIVLLYCPNDKDMLERMINSGIADEKDYLNILELIGQTEASIYDLMKLYNLHKNQITKIIDLLEAETLIYKDENTKKYYKSANMNSLSLIQNSRIRQAKLDELNLMVAYAENHSECLMNYIINHLGESEIKRCGQCQNCHRVPTILTEFNTVSIQQAEQFINQQHLLIKPKDKWPIGGSKGFKGKIPENLRFFEGRALCLYQNEGLGELVIRDRYQNGFFGDELVANCVQYIKDHYEELNSPKWITAVPSLRNPDLVPKFTERVAALLNIPYKQVLLKVEDTPEQKYMKNANKQAANIMDAFTISDALLEGPVLLIDDIMNSGWTFAICAMKLKEAGCESITPLALSKT